MELGFNTGWGQTPGKQLCRKGTGGPGGHQVDREPAMCPGSKGSQQPPGLHLAEHCQQANGGDPSPLHSTREATGGVLGAVMGSPVQHRHGPAEASPVTAYEDDEETGASV